MTKTVEFDQIQGIARFGYRKLTECSFVLVTIQDAAAARQWLAAAPVTNAVTMTDAPQTALQIALTHEGLRQLGCEPELLSQFSAEFQSGLNNGARSRLLGDVDRSAPEFWEWGTGAQSVHLLLMLYARTGGLAEWKRSLQAEGWDEAFRVVKELTTADMDGVEPFGFPDGLSQPELDWERQRSPPSIEATYTNRIALGECLLGYPNEYKRYTDRPLLPPDAPGAEMLPEAEDRPEVRDFGRNGSYLVLRTLAQDVEGFWSFVRAQSETEEAAEALAAAMVGRRKDGMPLVALNDDTVPGIDTADRLNRFHFDADPDGKQCPFGAHIRRANPRNGDLPSPPVRGIRWLLTLLGFEPKTLQSDAKASSRFHRILRRGREFGALSNTSEAASVSSTRGIHFICLNANIARQFEFLQSAWMMSAKFDAMCDESDPLIGSRQALDGTSPTDAFSIPRERGGPRVVSGVPRFVTVLGGAYFFLPSLPALRYLATKR